MDVVPWLQLGGLTIVGVVLWYLIRLVGSGEWVPKQTVDTLLGGRDAEIERSNKRGDEWHDAFDAQQHRANLLLDQNRELIEVARTVEHVMESLEDVARKTGGTDVPS